MSKCTEFQHSLIPTAEIVMLKFRTTSFACMILILYNSSVKRILFQVTYEKPHNTAFTPQLSHTLVWNTRDADKQSDSNSEKCKCRLTMYHSWNAAWPIKFKDWN